MKLKINEKVLCIPPFISTTWDRVAFLKTEANTETNQLNLILSLLDGKEIIIPSLDASIVDIAFAAHLKYLELSQAKDNAKINNIFANINPEQIIGLPLRLGASGIEGLESALQHNSAQANTPDIPLEILNKISAITKIISNGENIPFPKPEPHCNCVHCQLARAVHGITKDEEAITSQEESVTEEDLKFRLWDINQNGDKLYTVTNPLDIKEQYSVYLGDPIGCTCGEPKCVHIRAVLNS